MLKVCLLVLLLCSNEATDRRGLRRISTWATFYVGTRTKSRAKLINKREKENNFSRDEQRLTDSEKWHRRASTASDSDVMSSDPRVSKASRGRAISFVYFLSGWIPQLSCQCTELHEHVHCALDHTANTRSTDFIASQHEKELPLF